MKISKSAVVLLDKKLKSTSRRKSKATLLPRNPKNMFRFLHTLEKLLNSLNPKSYKSITSKEASESAPNPHTTATICRKPCHESHLPTGNTRCLTRDNPGIRTLHRRNPPVEFRPILLAPPSSLRILVAFL